MGVPMAVSLLLWKYLPQKIIVFVLKTGNIKCFKTLPTIRSLFLWFKQCLHVLAPSLWSIFRYGNSTFKEGNCISLNFIFLIFLINEVLPCIYYGSFCAAAFKNKQIQSDNCFEPRFDPLQIGRKCGNKVNNLYSMDKP